MAAPDKGVPDDIAAKATCVTVVPGFKKGAFLVGGQSGQGVVYLPHRPRLERARLHPDDWRQLRPSGRRESTDLVLIGTTRDAFQRLLHDKVNLGGDASVAAGPVKCKYQAAATEIANATSLSYFTTRASSPESTSPVT